MQTRSIRPILKPLRNALPSAWRRRETHEVLPDLDSPYGGVIPGAKRCMAVGLGFNREGDCASYRWPGSSYCYYHTKIQLGLCEPESNLYPVQPLPVGGYVLLQAAA